MTTNPQGVGDIPHSVQLVCDPDDDEWVFEMYGEDEDFFSVDENGLVTAVGSGHGTIHCYHGENADEVEVPVYVDMMPAPV